MNLSFFQSAYCIDLKKSYYEKDIRVDKLQIEMILTFCRLLVTPVFKNVSSVPTFTQGTHVYLCHSTMAKKNVSFFFIHYITHMAIFLDSVYQLLIFYCTIRPHQHYHLPPHQQDSCRVQLPSQWGEIISEEAFLFSIFTGI